MPRNLRWLLVGLLFLVLALFSLLVQAETVRVAGPATISRDLYRAVLCQVRDGRVGPACAEADAMYDHLVAWQVDPAVELAFALKETECGHTGPGRPPQRNLHNIECNAFDGGSCRGPYHARFQSYPSYLHAVDAFARLLRTGRPYEPAGRYTVAQVLPIYAPPFENDTALYIAQVETWVAFWRSIDPSYRGEDVTTVSATPSPVPTTPVPVSAPPVDVTPCREARTTQATDLRAAPGGEVLRTLPAETPVRVRCQDQVTRTAAMDGRIWVQVQDDDSVLYPWIDVKDLEAIK